MKFARSMVYQQLGIQESRAIEVEARDLTKDQIDKLIEHFIDDGAEPEYGLPGEKIEQDRKH